MYIIRSESAYLMPVLFYQYNWMRNPEGTTKYIQATLSTPPPSIFSLQILSRWLYSVSFSTEHKPDFLHYLYHKFCNYSVKTGMLST